MQQLLGFLILTELYNACFEFSAGNKDFNGHSPCYSKLPEESGRLTLSVTLPLTLSLSLTLSIDRQFTDCHDIGTHRFLDSLNKSLYAY